MGAELDAKLAAVTFEIARVHQRFPTLGRTDVRYAHYDGDLPFRILFGFNGRYVTLLWIERQAADET